MELGTSLPDMRLRAGADLGDRERTGGVGTAAAWMLCSRSKPGGGIESALSLSTSIDSGVQA